MSAPVSRGMITKTPSDNPLPRRGQMKIKESIAKQIVAAAAATASALVCDAGGGGGKKLAGGKVLPAEAAPGSAKKK